MNAGRHPGPPWLTRRAFLLGTAGVAGAVALAGCSSSGSGSSGATLAPFFATGTNEPPILRSGVEQRMPWGIADNEGLPMTNLPQTASVTLRDAENRPVGSPIEVQRHGDGTPFPYYPVRTTFAAPGNYTVAVDYKGHSLSSGIVVAAPDQITLVQPGERAIPVVTPTPADHRGVEPICTRDPMCPFHAATLSDALGNGHPTAFLISSPAYCQTNVCGPVLELLISEGSNRPLNVVHAEVYADAAATGDVLKAQLSEATMAYKLSFEPSLVIADAKGMVVDRLDFVFDRAELDEALGKVT